MRMIDSKKLSVDSGGREGGGRAHPSAVAALLHLEAHVGP